MPKRMTEQSGKSGGGRPSAHRLAKFEPGTAHLDAWPLSQMRSAAEVWNFRRPSDTSAGRAAL